MSKPMSGGPDQSSFIQVWRGIAVLLVVVYHYTTRLNDANGAAAVEPVWFAESLGKIGVLIFFVISGYLIAASLENCRSIAHFLAKRVARIWPLYAIACGAVFLFMQVLPPPQTATFMETAPGFKDLLLNLVFLNDLGESVDGAFWSIIVELKFYIFLAVFAALFRAHYALVFGWFAIALGAADLLMLAAASGDPALAGGIWRPVSRLMHGLLITPYLPFFALGVLTYRKASPGVWSALLVLSGAIALLSVAEDGHFNWAQDVQFLLVLAVLLAADAAIKNTLFVWLGNYSYSFYLFHQVIGLTIIDRLEDKVGSVLAVVVAFAVVLALSVAMSKAFEWRFYRATLTLLERMFSQLGLGRIEPPRGTVSQPVGAPHPTTAG